jgi:chromate transport protein ChrA
MFDVLFWIYLVNSVLLIDHEIDSAYWKEWDLFRLPGGINVFLILHLPLLFLLMYGLVLVFQEYNTGLVFSLVFGIGGVFAFTIHTMFIRMGRSEFKTPISLILLVTILLVSLIQIGVSIHLLAT